MVLYTATSTRLSIEVMMKSRTASSEVRYWSASTPIAHTFEPDSSENDLAASNRPPPEPPAAWYTMSAPFSYIDWAISRPRSGALKPEKSGGSLMYSDNTLASGLVAATPAMKPASNLPIRSMETPPMKPIVSDSDLRPAAAPTRNEPSCSAKPREATFGASTQPSMIAKLVSGYSAATSVIVSANRKPTPITRSLSSA
ncbi:MAG: hypothetical protein MAG471_01742 [Acidimicrobiaceae bacterium]|nr:hypothetical protein [Acidimicrobiaceae bacterium]